MRSTGPPGSGPARPRKSGSAPATRPSRRTTRTRRTRTRKSPEVTPSEVARLRPRAPLGASAVVHAGPFAQRRQVGDDDAAPLGTQPAPVGERADRLVDALPGAAGHLGELALVQLDRHHRRLAVAGQPDQGLGDPSGQVEEDVVGVLLGEPADQGAQRTYLRVSGAL